MDLREGQNAPDFELPDQHGVKHSLFQYRGKWVLLYFYPKDDTPGCTAEAKGIRDSFSDFNDAGAIVLGVSTDSAASHKKFIDKYQLPFTLLSDESKEVVRTYGVWGPKKFLGREFLGTKRVSFLINPDGILAKIYKNVKPKEHAAEVVHGINEYAA